jgi:hypothetical protein
MISATVLIACPSCSCHAFARESRCPGCGALLRAPDGSLQRTAGAAFLGLTLAFTVACSSETHGGGTSSEAGTGGTSSSSSNGMGGFQTMSTYGTAASGGFSGGSTTAASSTTGTTGTGGAGGAGGSK